MTGHLLQERHISTKGWEALRGMKKDKSQAEDTHAQGRSGWIQTVFGEENSGGTV